MGKRQKRGRGRRTARWLWVITLIPAAYLLGALAGSLIPVNRGWTEPASGTAVYIASNAVHTDILMPVDAQRLDWRPLFPSRDFGGIAPDGGWVAIGAGEEHVYLDTPTWWDLTPRTVLAALTGGKRVMHVQYVGTPAYADRQIRLRPDEYRRLWAAVRADFVLGPDGKPKRIRHPGYGPADAFYRATGKQSLLMSCNNSVARWLRLAGVRTSLWPPFAPGLVWRYRRSSYST